MPLGEKARVPRTPTGMELSRLPQLAGRRRTLPGRLGMRRENLMTHSRLLREEDFDSSVLREAADKLNFISRLAFAYRAPELVRFLQTLARSLRPLEEGLRAELVSRN